MGKTTLERLRAAVLKLSEPDRAELAQKLVASLDGTPDPGVASAWDADILRRLAEIDAGTAKLIDRTEFSRRMRARIHRA